MQRMQKGLFNTPCKPVFHNTANATQLLDGDHGFGHYVGEIGMQRAVDLATKHGIGVVGVRNSNFFGAGAWFVNLAAEAGMVGLALSNSFPKVAAYGGIKAALGTNPFAFGAPRRDANHLLLDMATSAGAGSTVRECLRAGKPLPEGMAIDAEGKSISDPKKFSSGTMLPMAGAKGYGLALMVEILSAVITGAGISHDVASMYNNFKDNGSNGHFLLALGISRWMEMEIYYQRMEQLVDIIKKSSDGDNEVLLPGETRWQNYAYNLVQGVPLDEITRGYLLELSQVYGIQAPWQSQD
jgi:ureidoglycolate dehydrogenase (NAD+)